MSWPATMSWKIVDSSSWVSSRSSPSRALISALTRSSPGLACFASTSAPSIATTTSEASLARRTRSGVEVGHEQPDESSTELGPIRLGHAEQLADDGERQRERERADEIDPASGPAAAMSSSRSSTMRLHARAQRLDAARREGGRDEPAQPGVIGRVDAEHVPRERRAREALGHDVAAGRQGGVHVLRQPRVVQRPRASS